MNNEFEVLFEPKITYGKMPKYKLGVKVINTNKKNIELTIEEKACLTIEKKINIVAKCNSKYIEKEDVFQEMCLILVENNYNIDDLVDEIVVKEIELKLNAKIRKYREQKQFKIPTFNKYNKKISANIISEKDFKHDDKCKEKLSNYDAISFEKWFEDEFKLGTRETTEYKKFKEIDFEEILSNKPRTREILELIKKGYNHTQIAKKLNIDRITVTRLLDIFRKNILNMINI